MIRQIVPGVYEKLAFYKMLIKTWQFRRENPGCVLFYDLYKNSQRKKYSQHNQDWIVRNYFFKNIKDGVFCDVGGNHPLNINNTRYFEELGWTGYAFEPLPHMEPLWKKHRKAILFPFAASDKEGDVVFSAVKDTTGWEDMLSFVKETSSVEHQYESEDIVVKARRLDEVFKEEGIVKIDYMSIDVEGHELNVLKGIDFQCVDISVLTVENNSSGGSVDALCGNREIREFMFENGYTLWGRIVGLDDIYVKKGFSY